MQIEELAGSVARDGLDGATTHVVLTPRDRLAPLSRPVSRKSSNA
jgi:hypothetical protein